MTHRDFTPNQTVRRLNPSVPELGGSGQAQAPKPFVRAGEAAEREGELHSAIMAECVKRGWKAFHGSMNHFTRRNPGEPDFTIAADGGRTFYVECKRKDGKLTVGQQAVFAQLRKLGHEPLLVRSLEEFKTFVDRL